MRDQVPSYPRLMRSRLTALGVLAGMWAALAGVLLPRLPKLPTPVLSRRLAGLVQPSPQGAWARLTGDAALLPAAEYQVVKSYLDPHEAGVVVVWRVRNLGRTPLEVGLDDWVLTNPRLSRCRFRAGALDRLPVMVPPQGTSDELVSAFAMRKRCLGPKQALQLQPKLTMPPGRSALRQLLLEMLGLRLRVAPQAASEELWHELMLGP